MAINRGKQFEQKFKEDFLKLADSNLDRLSDQMTGYKGSSSNICDFICYVYPNQFYIECKSCKGNTFPFSSLRQYIKMLSKAGKKGIRVGIVIWYIDHDKVIYVPVNTICMMKKDKKKSINIKNIDQYNIILLPSVKKRVFLDTDYTPLLFLEEGE